jgi:ATP-dependent exoDNAse (exonuclease V) beta subunit
MQLLVETYKEQINVFNHIQFAMEDHIYHIDGKKAQSVTTILNNYVKPFEREYWANIKAKKLGISPSEILEQWEFGAKLSKVKGTLVHSFMESNLTASKFTYPEEAIMQAFGYDPIQDSFNQILPQAQKFIADIQDKMFPIASELIIGDSEYLVCGTIDQLFYNKKSGKLEIWDWKTNKAIKTISKYFHLAPLAHIPDTELDHYSLQLSLYKLILAKNTGLELGECYLTWFNETKPAYTVFRAKDYRAEAILILNSLKLL